MNKKTSIIDILMYFTFFILGLYAALHLGYSLYINQKPGEVIDLTLVLDTTTKTIQQNPIIFIKYFSFKNIIGRLSLFYIMGCLLAVLWFATSKKNYMKGKEHGSARWGTIKESQKLIDKDLKNNIILTNDTQMSLNTRKTRKNNNVLVIGGSGAGKSRFYNKPNIMQANTSYVITDPKGELLESTGKLLVAEGYKVKVFNLIHMQHSTNYNPFKYIRSDNDILKLINNIIKNTNGGQKSVDPFWDKAETALLVAIIGYLWYEAEETEQNFSMVMEMLRYAAVKEEDEGYKSPLDELFEELKEIDYNHLAVKYYDVFKLATAKTAKSILVSCSVRLAIFNLDEVKSLMSSDGIDIPTIGEQKTALFIIIPDSDDTFNCLVAMMYAQVFDTLYNLADFKYSGRLPYHVRCMLDEFANIGVIPNFDKLISTMRSREISASVIIQNLSQLKTMYKDSWESIVGNCDSFLFLGGMERTSLDYISKGLGKMTIDTLNRSVSRGKSNSTSRNEGIVGRELLTSNEVGEMPDEDCILFIRGKKPFYNKKFNIEKHGRYNMLGEDNMPENKFDVTSIKTIDYSDNEEKMKEDEEETLYYVEELSISEHDEYILDYEDLEKKPSFNKKEDLNIEQYPIKRDLRERFEPVLTEEELQAAVQALEDIKITAVEEQMTEEETIQDMIDNLPPVEDAEIKETDEYVYLYEEEESKTS